MSAVAAQRRGHGLVTAIGFLTRLPMPRRARMQAGDLAAAVAWFPVVGLVVGGLAAGTRLAAGEVLSAGAATVLALAVAVVVTGGLHEDGLADTADAFGAHVDRARRLEIMRDSRLGTFGVLALVLALLAATAILAPLDARDAAAALVAGHVLARWAMLVHSVSAPNARDAGAGALLDVRPVPLAAATLATAAIVAGVAGPAAGGAAAGVTLAVVAAMAATTRAAVGGTTGDTHGATGKLVEIAVFAAVAAIAA